LQALAQRVSSAKIHIDSKVYSSINRGILAYVCFEKDDNEEVIEKFIHKIINFSFFKGDRGVMSTSLKEIKGELMIVSQFTLSALTNKETNRVFIKQQGTEKAKYLYDLLIKRLKEFPILFSQECLDLIWIFIL
jgi:D-tyrosyl-tRNA(Tyr) deacylase